MVVVIGVGVGKAVGDGDGVVSCGCTRPTKTNEIQKIMARRIIGGLNTKRQRYQSIMKPIYASLILTFFALPVTAKDRHCMFRVHTEANPSDGATFTTSVKASFSGKRVAIEKIPRLSERDVVAFYPYPASDGSNGVLFQLDEHGRLALDTLSEEKHGSLLFIFMNGRPVD